MLQKALETLRNQNQKILVCLGNDKQAETQWLAAGGSAGHLLSEKQLQSILLTGGVVLPNELAFSGTLETFVSLFPKSQVEQSKRLINDFLSGAVAEYESGKWSFFTCKVVVMGCCMGEYLSIVNRKEISDLY